MSKFILTADLHIKDGLYLQVGLDYLDYIYSYATENKINKIAFLGDLLDKSNKIKNEVFIPLFKKIEQFKENGLEMWFILGNHDITSTITNSSLLEVFEKYGHLVNSPETFEFGDTVINMAPYSKDPNLIPTVNADYLFTHINVIGFDLGKGTYASEEQQAFPVSMFSNYKKVFTGHYHKRQEMDNVEYLGAPYQLNFGDAGDCNKGFVIFDTDNGNEEFVKYENAPLFKEYTYDCIWNDIKSGKLSSGDLQNNLVKIVIDKKVDALAELKSRLYNEFGVIDIKNEFENAEKEELASGVKIEMNKTSSEMIEEFISKISVERDGFNISGKDLLEKFSQIKGDL